MTTQKINGNIPRVSPGTVQRRVNKIVL